MCNKYKKKGPSYCSSHYILYHELYDSILTDLRETLQTIQADRKIFVDTVLRKVEESCGCERKGIEQEMQSLQDRISSLDKRYEQLYEDRLAGLISNQKFKELSGKCETEQGSLSERPEILEQKIKSQGIGASEIEDFVRLVEKYETPTKLDRELLNRLIDSIEIGDRIKEPEGTKQSITINYKFVGKIA